MNKKELIEAILKKGQIVKDGATYNELQQQYYALLRAEKPPEPPVETKAEFTEADFKAAADIIKTVKKHGQDIASLKMYIISVAILSIGFTLIIILIKKQS